MGRSRPLTSWMVSFSEHAKKLSADQYWILYRQLCRDFPYVRLAYTPIGDQVTFEDMSGKAPGLAFRHFFSLRFKPNPAREYSITVDRQNLDGPRSQSLCQFDQVRDSGRKLQSSPINVLLPRRCAREWHRATGPTIHCSILPQ